MIEFDESILGIWFVQLSAESDWMAALHQHESGGVKLLYRFRYYETRGAWDGLDRKKWYEAKLSERDARTACAKMNGVATHLAHAADNAACYACVRGERSLEEFTDYFLTMPFAHAKFEGEAEEWLRKRHPDGLPKGLEAAIARSKGAHR